MAIAGASTFVPVLLFGILRVNLFLDTIRARSDWQNLVSDSGQSGFHLRLSNLLTGIARC